MAELVIRRGLEEPDTSDNFTPHRPARPEKSLPGEKFELVSDYQPAGDQPTAIGELVKTAQEDEKTQVLLGVTGSGKTYTMAQVIERLQRPALILAPNKILAAQLYGEFKSFFPNNAVEYFVSYYDYYQPEAYVPRSDTYIEKESSVNEAIDRMRHSATRALLERDDVIIVASVSCLYGIGSVETYSAMIFDIKEGESVDQRELIRKLVALQYKRNDVAFARGNFRVRGDNLEIFPSHYEDTAWRISFFGDDIEEIVEFDPLTGKPGRKLEKVRVYANSHYVTPGPTMKQASEAIRFELAERLKELEAEGKLLEHQRLEQRTNFDLEMIAATGSCNGIENYSRFLTGRLPGEPPPTLFEYLPENALLFVDESHQTVPQIGARIMQFDLGDHASIFVNENETGKTYQPSENAPWHNYGGYKVWPAPQDRWGWPPPPNLDFGVYEASVEVNTADSTTVFVAGPIEQWQTPNLRLARRITLYRGSSRVRVEQTIINEGDAPDTWSVWDVTQQIVHHPGERDYENFWVYFPLNPESRYGASGVRSSDTSNAWTGAVAPGIYGVKFVPDNKKLFSDSLGGWISYVDEREGYTYAKTFPLLSQHPKGRTSTTATPSKKHWVTGPPSPA